MTLYFFRILHNIVNVQSTLYLNKYILNAINNHKNGAQQLWPSSVFVVLQWGERLERLVVTIFLDLAAFQVLHP